MMSSVEAVLVGLRVVPVLLLLVSLVPSLVSVVMFELVMGTCPHLRKHYVPAQKFGGKKREEIHPCLQ